MTIVPRLFDPPRERSYFLFGPRGTGKSTWLRQTYPEALFIDLLDPGVHRRFLARPEELRELIGAHPRTATVVIDEVQKAPDLLSAVHQIIEEKRGLQFVLTGSSARKLKRGAANLLAGRALLRQFHPFLAAELGERFSLEAALERGMLPLVVTAASPEEVLASYVGLYVREEVQAEGLVRNIGSFARFTEAVSFAHAQALNIAAVARECEVERKTVEGYLTVLEDLLLAFRLPAFTRRARRAVRAHPKLYLFDAGVFRSLRPSGPLDSPGEIDGAALEGLVVQHVRAWATATAAQPARLYYWRTRSGLEVDLVVYGPAGFWAIEVKNAGRVRPEDLRAIRAFVEEFPQCTPLLLYRGRQRLLKEGVMCVPCDEFLRQVRPGTPLWGGTAAE